MDQARSSATEACLLDNVNVVVLLDVDPIGPAEGVWYLVRAVLESGPGSYDSGGEQQTANRDAGINASVQACP